jgi:beta-lactamase regulating signal transducer with metallopeptidase domain
VRHWVWLAASVKFLVSFSLLVSLDSQVEWRTAPARAHAQVPSIVAELGQPFAPTVQASRGPETPAGTSRMPAILLGVWFCGFAVGTHGWMRQWRRVRSAVRRGAPMDLGAPIPVVSCTERLEPGVFGIRRPVLLLPDGIAEQLPAEQLSAILVHELCHVRRRENLAAAVHIVVEAIFWFHQAVWWIGVRLMEAASAPVTKRLCKRPASRRPMPVAF